MGSRLSASGGLQELLTRAVVAACRIGLDEEGSTVHKRPAFMGALASTLQPPRRSRLLEAQRRCSTGPNVGALIPALPTIPHEIIGAGAWVAGRLILRDALPDNRLPDVHVAG